MATLDVHQELSELDSHSKKILRQQELQQFVKVNALEPSVVAEALQN